jgi:hypothetical protein
LSDQQDQPPDEEPAEPDTGQPPADDPPSEEEIKDPFEREQIRYTTGAEPILGVTLDGPKVGKRSIDVFTFGEFLAQLDRVVRGLTATLEGVSLSATGRIPRPPDAAPWRTVGLVFGDSATIDFVLGEPEKLKLSPDGAVTSPTIEAVTTLTKFVALDAAPAVEVVRDFDDRVGNDFSHLLALLADNALASRWRHPGAIAPIEVPAERADRLRNALRAEVEPVTSIVTVSGFLFRLDAIRNDFRLQPEDEGPPITGHYDDMLIPELRDAWSHRVVAELYRTEHRYAYATAPFRVEHQLRAILRKLGRVEGEQGTL